MNSGSTHSGNSTSSLVVALTGGIGSGKSAVAEMFRARNSAVFDSDVIARDLVQPGMQALRDIADQFGESMLTASGELDRPRMRELVFRDPLERQRLEAILHPRVREALLGAVRQCTQTYCLLVIPLLTEVRADYDFIDRVLVTDVSPQTQVVRLMQRDRCSADQAFRMIAAQAHRNERLALADDIIDNDGDTAALVPVVERLHHLFCVLPLPKSRQTL